LDIDSVLFLDQGDRALGAIFDVIGQVKQPFYCIRFNSLEHISSKGVEKGMLVYCAPATPHTCNKLFIFVDKLFNLTNNF
jgi:H/ACA ribonucleoprotein complex non-core subunit NAF1